MTRTLVDPATAGMTLPDYGWARRPDWERAWDEVVARVGEDFSGGVVQRAADPIERSAVRRYLEPLEFDCPLHYDAEVARAHGYDDIVAPYSGLATWISEGVWNPGQDAVWTDADRNAQVSPRGLLTYPMPGPATDSALQTDVEHEFFSTPVVGDWLTASGMKLLICTPKETSVGRGAFQTWETQVRVDDGELLAMIRATCFFYVAYERS